MEYLLHPDEVYYMVKMKMRATPPQQRASKELAYIYEILAKTSRSFALVIQELGNQLRDAVCIFYLVLRGLDTVEDDRNFPLEPRVALLRDFFNKLDQPGWTFDKAGENEHERELLRNFDKVIAVYRTLDPGFQKIIREITQRMGAGMADFSDKEIETKADYDLYCHYVAGLVGIGLSRLFAFSKLEQPIFNEMDDLSNNMGLFLQKTNIIRDYREDIDHKRMFWPKEIWGKYTDNLSNFKLPVNAEKAVFCLNDLITDAFTHIPGCLIYMSRLRDQKVFNFCAIPQVMAVATLAECYSNHNVFLGPVKIRRGLTAKMVDQSTTMDSVNFYFAVCLDIAESKLIPNDPNRQQMVKAIQEARRQLPPNARTAPFGAADVIAVAAITAGSYYLLRRSKL